ncbi:MAG: DUF1223 domain-containing protein [Anderseniella sp.]
MKKNSHITRRSVLAGGAAITATASSGSINLARASNDRPVFVELFTSQGCSSCPPADDFLAELVDRPGIISASMHVDYWDYLGWRDTLGSSAFSLRQKEYAIRRGDGRVYTPQMVINGRAHVVGSHKQAVLEEIARQSETANEYYVPIEISTNDDALVIDVAGGPTDRIIQSSSVWALSISPKENVQIKRGENTGRNITYHNVVKQMTPVGMWKGEAKKFTLPKAPIMNKQNSMCVAILQVDGGGPILGCAKMSTAV